MTVEGHLGLVKEVKLTFKKMEVIFILFIFYFFPFPSVPKLMCLWPPKLKALWSSTGSQHMSVLFFKVHLVFCFDQNSKSQTSLVYYLPINFVQIIVNNNLLFSLVNRIHKDMSKKR